MIHRHTSTTEQQQQPRSCVYLRICHRQQLGTQSFTSHPSHPVLHHLQCHVMMLCTLPCHRWRRWRPRDVRALCLLKPRWAVLDSRCPSTAYPDTSVWRPSVLPSPPNFGLSRCKRVLISTYALHAPVSLNISSLLFSQIPWYP